MLNPARIFQLSLLSFLLYLPFLGKGLSNDDLVFLDYAKRLTMNPTVCSVTDYLFLGVELKDLVVFESTHPPLVPYVLRIALHLFGERLWVLHLVMFGFLWLATVNLAALIARHTRFSPLLALGLTMGPIFLPNATSLMTDVALFAFWFTAINAFDLALDANGTLLSRWHWLTGLATVGAIFTAYQGLGLLFILPLMALLRRKVIDGLVWAAACVAPFALWVLMVWLHYQILPYFSPPRSEISIANEVHKGLVWLNISLKSRAMVFHLGAALLCFAPLLIWRRGRSGLLLAAAGWGLAISAYLFPDKGFWFTCYATLLAAAGTLALMVVLEGLWQALTEADEGRALRFALLASFAGFALFQVLLASFAAPRYSLIPIGAVFLLGLARKDSQPGPWQWLCLLPTLVLGLAVAWADYRFAQSQRIDRLGLPKGAIHVAGEKGIQYSGERAGYTYFLPHKTEDVSLLLVPQENDHVAVPSALLESAELVQTYYVHSALPIRIMNREAEAGFYIHNHGMLPFSFSTQAVDAYKLYRIFQPGFPSWVERPNASAPAGEILPEAPVYQDFTCTPNGLTTFRLMLATYNRSNPSTLVVSLHELKDGEMGTAVFEKRMRATELQDNQWHRFDFPPLESKGKRYRLLLSSPDATPATAVTIWTNSNADGTYHRGPEQKHGMLAFEALASK